VGHLKGAIIGFGFIAERGHLPAYALHGDIEIAAVADGCPARREAAARALPNAKIFASHEALLAECSASLDFVDVCTPPYAHAPIALAALDEGLHVLCEKPLATSAADARAMLARATEARRVLFPSHNYRHAPVIKAVRSVLEEGALGDVHLVTLDTFRATHARGTPEWNEHWRRDRRYSGGGIGMDHGSHTFYLAFEWLRSYPTAIAATTSSRDARDTEETFAARVTFPTGVAHATLTWAAGVRKVIYTLHGERGALRVEDDDLELSLMHGTGKDARWDVTRRSVASAWMDASHAPWFASMLATFRGAIVADDFVGRDARDALKSVELINAGYRSAAAGGKEVALEAGGAELALDAGGGEATTDAPRGANAAAGAEPALGLAS
jgi:predicted dehydrogenase